MLHEEKIKNKITRRFLMAGLVEGYSYLLLFFVAMPLKYFAEMPIYVKVVGLIHGVLVVLYLILLIQMYVQLKLPLKNSIFALLLSLIPFGTFYLKRVIK